jgi:tyrosyl-tRNA synthetase
VKTSPYQFYQFWLNAADEDAIKWIRIFTFLTREEIESLIKENANDPSQRKLQKTLAREVTIFVHGESEYITAIKTTEKLFADQHRPAENLTADELENLEGIVKLVFPSEKIKEGIDVVSFLFESGIFTSKGEARKMIQNGGMQINRKKLDDTQITIDQHSLLHNKYILIQKGKKNYYLATVS